MAIVLTKLKNYEREISVNKNLRIAIVGATGMVGKTFLTVLEETPFAGARYTLFSSSRSAGTVVSFEGKDHTVQELTESSFDSGYDIALFSAGGDTSRKFAPIAASHGCVVVDNSSAWRMDENVPLIVPEVNAHAALGHKGIIANPNCNVIPAVVALKPIFDAYGISRIVFSTYQSASGAGRSGVEALQNELAGKTQNKFPHPIAGNCIPQIESFLENGYTKEEMKMLHETRKIFGDNSIQATATTVRVPVAVGHSVSVNVQTKKPFDLNELKECMRAFPGLIVMDDPQNSIYPTPLETQGRNEVFAGRIRRDESVENGLNMWVVADNIRKGAATNAVQIAQLLV